jgi:CxxC motif-containing protein
VPPDRLEDVERALRELEAEAPVYVSQVLLRNVCGTGANVVAAGSIPCKK